MRQGPCKDCTDRQFGCQAVCPKYKEFDACNKREQEERQKRYRSASDLAAAKSGVRRHCEHMKRH